ncbi:DnaT-like ssDNA-binding domain-containing protein [Cronobacter sakazakii]
MASSWIKVEVITPDKPEIFQIAEILNIDPDAVLGKLVRIWAWADQQTIDGNAGSVTKGVLDRLAFITGFADALITVGWLAYEDGRLVLPNFERHNGESSKKRALTNRRVAEHRKRETQKVTQPALRKELPEEEEEEEEDIKDKTPYSARGKFEPVDNLHDQRIPKKPDPGAGNFVMDGYVPPGGSGHMGKFAISPDWKPDPDFRKQAAIWGIPLTKEVTPQELASFIDFWQAEGKAFHHTQWQQKLARSVQQSRNRVNGRIGRDVNAIPEPEDEIPPGFRG